MHGHVSIGAVTRILVLAFALSLFGTSALAQEKENTSSKEAEVKPLPARTQALLRDYNTKYFRLRTDSDAIFAQTLGTQIDAFADAVQDRFLALFGTVLPVPKMSLIVFERREDYRTYAETNAPKLANNGGYYDGAMRSVVTYRYNNVELYYHELVHGMMGELFDDHHFYRYTHEDWPVWFDEGLAEYLANDAMNQNKSTLSNPGKYAVLFNAMRNKKLPTLSSVVDARSGSFSGPTMALNYAMAWGLLAYLIEELEGTEAFKRYLQKLLKGIPDRTAFKESFGAHLENMEEAWKKWLVRKMQNLPPREALLSQNSLDGWTIHEGGKWSGEGKQIHARSSGEYDYLIRNIMPVGDFRLQVRIKVSSGRAGIILGNNSNGSYPYEYLFDFTRKKTGVRESKTAIHLVPIGKEAPPIDLDTWHHVVLEAVRGELRFSVDGKLVTETPVTQRVFSLLGFYVHKGNAIFENPVLLRGPIPSPSLPKK